MSTKLEKHLYPRGRSVTEPTLMPNVLASEGDIVTFNSPRRLTTEATVVNLGDAPNSNNGDPLRTAFAKINNFIEASYWVNDSINEKFQEIDSELREGIFIYGDLDSDTNNNDSERTRLRYNVSLLDNSSSIHFNGYPNQIEVSLGRMKNLINNPYDFDSEVRINFGLASTVHLNSLRVFEDAQFDSDVNIAGKTTLQNPLTVDSEATFNGDVLFNKDIQINGQVTGRARFQEHVFFDSDIEVAGRIEVTGHVDIDNDLTVLGKAYIRESLVVDSDVTIAGDVVINQQVAINDEIYVEGNARFDSDVFITGNLTVEGTTTTIDSTTVNIGDNVLELNYGGAQTDAGLLVTDSTAPNTVSGSLLWDGTNDKWTGGALGSEKELARLNDGSNTDGVIQKYNSDGLLTDSVLSDDGTDGTFSGDLIVTGLSAGTNGAFLYADADDKLQAVNASTAGDVIQWDGSSFVASRELDGGTF